jgi:hypothetical protein
LPCGYGCGYAKATFGSCDLAELTGADVERFLHALDAAGKERGRSPSRTTLAKHLRYLHACLEEAIPRYLARMDFGSNNPTAWHLWAVDHDGNFVVADEYYAPGLLASQHAAEILRCRSPQRAGDGPVGLNWWEGRDDRDRPVGNVCYGDPSIQNAFGTTNRRGKPATTRREFDECGVHISLGNNERRAGYERLRELLHLEPGRIPPPWSQIPRGGAAPGCMCSRPRSG